MKAAGIGDFRNRLPGIGKKGQTLFNAIGQKVGDWRHRKMFPEHNSQLFFENCIEEETKEKISRKRKIFWRTEGNPERGNPFPGEKETKVKVKNVS